MLSAARLRELVDYDPLSGVFTSRVDSRGKRYPAGRVLRASSGRYLQTELDGERHYLHRLAFLYMTGQWPAGSVDHKDGDPTNNRWSNLRDVSHTVNVQNIRQATRRNISTGVLGVTFDKARGKYEASVKHGHTRIRRRFDSLEDARAFYVAAKRQLHEGCTL